MARARWPRRARWEIVAPLAEVDRVVEALAESYLKRAAGVLVPKPYPVGIGGVNETGSPCEHMRPIQLLKLSITGAVSVPRHLYGWEASPLYSREGSGVD